MKATESVRGYASGVLDVRSRIKRIKELPPLASLKGYELGDVPHDIVAGLVIAALSIPIAMGYAEIAGLTPVYGLYASILPAIVFAVTTNTRIVIFGLDSAAVAVTGVVIAGLGVGLGSDGAFAVMPMLTMLVAAFLLLFSFTRAGKLVHYVPEPVMNGFILGVTITIVVHQLPKLFGTAAFDLMDLVSFAANVNILSLVLSMAMLAALFVIARLAPKLPGALIVLAIGLAVSVAFDLEGHGVVVLGDMPEGLPSFAFPQLTGMDTALMIGGAFSIAVTIAIESLLTLNVFCMREGTRSHGDRELASLALGNVASSFIGCPPCSASLSRTAAAKASGGVSQIAGIVGALTIAVFVLVLAPFLRYLPEPVLAAIVVFAIVQVVDFDAIVRYAKNVRIEFGVLVLVALVVVGFGALAGVGAGIGLSLITHIYRSHATGNRKLLGFAGDESDVDFDIPENTRVYYLRGFLSFANINRELKAIREGIDDDVDTVILEISGITNLDATAVEFLMRFIHSLGDQGVLVRIVRSLTLANDHYTRYELRRLLRKVSAYPTVKSAIEDVDRMKSKQLLDIPLGETEE